MHARLTASASALRVRLLVAFAASLLAVAVLAAAGAQSASAATTVPACTGATDTAVNPSLLVLTGQNEIDYNAGKAVLIYGNYGANAPSAPMGADPVPPSCAVRKVNGQPSTSWAYCTDARAHSCRNNGTPNLESVTGNAKFDPAVDALGPDKEKVIVYLIQHGYAIAQPNTGNMLGATSADETTSQNRQAMQQLVWCVSEAGPGVKTTASTLPQDAYLHDTCAANFDDADFDAVLAMVPSTPAMTVTAASPTVAPGATAQFTVSTNVLGKAITVTPTGIDGALTVCGGTGTLTGDQLVVPGTDSSTKTVTLCGTRAADGAMNVAATVVPATTQNLVWEWNNDADCQVYASFNNVTPMQLAANATVTVETTTTTTTPTTTTTTPTTTTPTTTTPTTTTTTTPTTTAPTTTKSRLGLTKTANGSSFRVGQRITYTLRVSNPSSSTMRGVRVCDTLPAGMAFVKASPSAKLSNGRYCWTVGSLKAKASKRFTLVVRVLGGAPSKVTNRATATGTNALSRTASKTVRIMRTAAKSGGVTG